MAPWNSGTSPNATWYAVAKARVASFSSLVGYGVLKTDPSAASAPAVLRKTSVPSGAAAEQDRVDAHRPGLLRDQSTLHLLGADEEGPGAALPDRGQVGGEVLLADRDHLVGDRV